jgi:hypothetical protein
MGEKIQSNPQESVFSFGSAVEACAALAAGPPQVTDLLRDFPAWRCWNPSDRSFAFNVADHIRLETLVTLVFARTLDVINHEVSHRAFLSSELQA